MTDKFINDEKDILSDILVMSFMNFDIEITEIDGVDPFYATKNWYEQTRTIDRVRQFLPENKYSFCLSEKPIVCLPDSNNRLYRLIIPFNRSNIYRMNLILKSFYSRIPKFGYCVEKCTNLSLGGLTLSRNRIGRYPVIFREILITNIKKKKCKI